MLLRNLLDNIYPFEVLPPYDAWDIQLICSDSRQVKKNSLFVALKGSKQNGLDFVKDAAARGARTFVIDETVNVDFINGDCCVLKVADPAGFLRKLAKNFYGNTSEKIRPIAVTGTNGKTTVAYLIESILQKNNKSCGVIGTVNYRLGSLIRPSLNTTPGLLENQQLLIEMINEGLDYCVMEVSSHALDQKRVDLIDFKIGIFTNLTSDHLDYHGTKENYFLAKAELFINLSSGAVAVINIDDVYGRKLISKTQAKVLTYGIENNANVMAKEIEMGISGTKFKLCIDKDAVVVRTKLIGIYNVYNILAASACAFSEGVNLEKIKAALETFLSAPGRLERIDCQQDFSIFIDYAHTQDALENVLRAIRQTSDAKIILVFGCGGDRDKTKRPLMGRVANQWADHCIVTSDNPRSEDPLSIIDEILEGFDKENFEVVVQRDEAIKKALIIAQKGDIVLLAGKGHETYQIFKDRTIKFDERKIIREFLRC